jgi:hypothetical protein
MGAAIRHFDAEHPAADEASALDRVAGRSLAPDVDVHLTGCAVVEANDDRVIAGVRMRDAVFP